MKKKKELLKNLSSYVVKVGKPRNVKRRLPIEGILTIEDGLFIQGKHSFKKTDHKPINLKLALSEDDLYRLSSYAISYERDFIWQFSLMLSDAIKQFKRGARGKHKGRETKVLHIKLEAGMLYQLFDKLCKEPSNKWPSSLQKLISNLPKKVKRSGKYDPTWLTAYYLEKHYDKTLSSLGINPFTKNIDNFFYIYIKPKLEMCEKLFSQMIPSGKGLPENIINNSPYNHILDSIT